MLEYLVGIPNCLMDTIMSPVTRMRDVDMKSKMQKMMIVSDGDLDTRKP